MSFQPRVFWWNAWMSLTDWLRGPVVWWTQKSTPFGHSTCRGTPRGARAPHCSRVTMEMANPVLRYLTGESVGHIVADSDDERKWGATNGR
jgi:hypothetical protein